MVTSKRDNPARGHLTARHLNLSASWCRNFQPPRKTIALTTRQEKPNITGMTLQFIDQGAIGIGPSESDRRIIRSHVMRGKNAGRPRPSTRKQTTIVHGKRVRTAPGILGSGYSKLGRQLLWNDLCLTSFPQQLDSESTKLMHRCTFSVLLSIPALFPSSSLTYSSQGSLTLAMRCFRPNSARNSTSSSRFGLIMSW